MAIAELPSQLSFTYYEEEEWKDKLKEINQGKNLNGKLTFKKLELLLKQLSVQNYITYSKEAAWKNVTRSQWNMIYEQILDLLDSNNQVSVANLVFLTEESKELEDGQNLQRLTQKGFYEVAEGVNYI